MKVSEFDCIQKGKWYIKDCFLRQAWQYTLPLSIADPSSAFFSPKYSQTWALVPGLETSSAVLAVVVVSVTSLGSVAIL